MISANSYGQLSRATLLALVEVCRMFNIPLEPWRESVEDQALAIASFHSINVPSEWGLTIFRSCPGFFPRVSIQLMSPASGDPSILNPYPARCPETVSKGQEKKW